jgi:hypothetical protein
VTETGDYISGMGEKSLTGKEKRLGSTRQMEKIRLGFEKSNHAVLFFSSIKCDYSPATTSKGISIYEL